VFCNSKLGCARLARSLERDGLRTSALHGDKSQDERLKSLDAFKRGEVDLLVATDVRTRWTATVAAALLRERGATQVLLLALHLRP
jgi:superfamily II helicase